MRCASRPVSPLCSTRSLGLAGAGRRRSGPHGAGRGAGRSGAAPRATVRWRGARTNSQRPLQFTLVILWLVDTRTIRLSVALHGPRHARGAGLLPTLACTDGNPRSDENDAHELDVLLLPAGAPGARARGAPGRRGDGLDRPGDGPRERHLRRHAGRRELLRALEVRAVRRGRGRLRPRPVRPRTRRSAASWRGPRRARRRGQEQPALRVAGQPGGRPVEDVHHVADVLLRNHHHEATRPRGHEATRSSYRRRSHRPRRPRSPRAPPRPATPSRPGCRAPRGSRGRATRGGTGRHGRRRSRPMAFDPWCRRSCRTFRRGCVAAGMAVARRRSCELLASHLDRVEVGTGEGGEAIEALAPWLARFGWRAPPSDRIRAD